jgi:hypothetical protein
MPDSQTPLEKKFFREKNTKGLLIRYNSLVVQIIILLFLCQHFAYVLLDPEKMAEVIWTLSLVKI